ncbi:MAG: hypothetical protein RR643_04895 [Anaerorhabdus sp.]|uniref:hypothetical protein n=1 Tax=Anaerorhabdus sp. TaxID=1872524 RepID=UPI002FC6D853
MRKVAEGKVIGETTFEKWVRFAEEAEDVKRAKDKLVRHLGMMDNVKLLVQVRIQKLKKDEDDGFNDGTMDEVRLAELAGGAHELTKLLELIKDMEEHIDA